MHGVVRRWSNGADLGDALMSRSKEVTKLISDVPGFRHYYAVVSGDSVATITICDDEKGTAESTRRARAWVQENLPGLSLGTPEVTEGEIFLDFGR